MDVTTTRRRRSSLRVLLVASVAALAFAIVPMASQAVALNVNLDQYANGGKTQAAGWQNGDLNQNNSTYGEGLVVPFRLAIEGLDPGTHSIHINYDFTSGGHEAYDFLATYNATENPGLCDPGGGGVSSLCTGGLPAPSVMQFPSDPFSFSDTGGAGPLSVAGAEAFAFAQNSNITRNLQLYGGTITNITGPVHSGSTDGNSTGDFTVTFDTTGNPGEVAVLFAWGGHLAQSAYWFLSVGGMADGAAAITGAPWHMRTQQLDGSGNKNQDRSIQPSAIVLAVSANSLRASRMGRRVVVRWRTSSEFDTLGFNVFRSVKGKSKRVKLNHRLIPAAAVLNGKSSSAYTFRKRLASKRLAARSRFYVQEVHINGSRTMYGPIRARNT